MFKIPLLNHDHAAEKRYDSGLQGADSLPLKLTLRAFWYILTPYWKSRDSLVSWLLLFLIVALTAGAIYIATAINKWYKTFWDTIQNYDVSGFKHELLIFAILASIHVVVSVYKAYLRSRLAIRWRRWLTGQVMGQWLDNDIYYKMQLADKKTENPDQRISEDLSLFVNATISLLIGTATDLAMLGTFGFVLWDLSHSVTFTLWNGYELWLPDGYLLYLAMIYAVAGTGLTFFFGRPLVRLNFRQQRYEADFRFSLIRVRENAESIALYRGEPRENQYLHERFAHVVKNYIRLIICEKRLGFFTLGYAQLAVIFPILVAAPMYFAKIITMGSIMQISSAFGRVQDSLSTIINNFSVWAAYKADIDRLALYFDSMYASDHIVCLEPEHEGDNFRTEALNVRDPFGRELCTNLNLNLKQGDSLLIRGLSGCGKSTLIRSIAGIWPFCDGRIILPEHARTLFLSQRPYLPQGTLRNAIGYPGQGEEQGLTEHYMEELSLTGLISSLDNDDHWSSILSLGEQQRIAFIRALILKPEVIFLDEASSALDEALESKAYALLRSTLPESIIVSVGHRSTLIEKHGLLLVCVDPKHWELKAASV